MHSYKCNQFLIMIFQSYQQLEGKHSSYYCVRLIVKNKPFYYF